MQKAIKFLVRSRVVLLKLCPRTKLFHTGAWNSVLISVFIVEKFDSFVIAIWRWILITVLYQFFGLTICVFNQPIQTSRFTWNRAFNNLLVMKYVYSNRSPGNISISSYGAAWRFIIFDSCYTSWCGDSLDVLPSLLWCCLTLIVSKCSLSIHDVSALFPDLISDAWL